MPQGDYEGALKRALLIYRQSGWKSLMQEGGVQGGSDDAKVMWVRFYLNSPPNWCNEIRGLWQAVRH